MRKALILILLVVGFTLIVSANASAYTYVWNTDVENTTGNVANDYHVKFVHDSPFTVDKTWTTGGDVSFPNVNVQGSGTTEVTIDYSGATVNSGQDTHIGAAFSVPWRKLKVAEVYWTFGGMELLPRTVLLDPDRTGASGTAGYGLARYELYNETGTEYLSVNWQEMDGGSGSFVLTNNNDVNVTVVGLTYRFSLDLVPLEDLNPSLEFPPSTTPDFVLHTGESFSFEIGPVGGIEIPVNKLELLAPYLISAALIISAVAVTILYLTRRKKQ